MRKQELHPRTAIINKTQKNQSKKARNEALNWLAATFPKAFDTTVAIHPLKIGIMDDILLHIDKALAAGISRSKIREALVLFTRRIDYLACLKSREFRVDLDGNPVTMVTEEEAEKAAVKIKKRIEKNTRSVRTLLNPHALKQDKAYTKPPTYTLHEPAPAYDALSRVSAPASPSKAVTLVKHKSTRSYDPAAVARLKEKLGLSKKEENPVES